MASDFVLAIETSCDETAVAITDCDGRPIVSTVSSQIALHAPYGGVVPEVASRNHSVDLRPLIEQALREAGIARDQISAIAATSGPGLASSLLIGDTTAKALAVGLGCPFYSINHMEGHLLSPFIHVNRSIAPHVALIVSGGHTLLIDVAGVGNYRLLGSTRDDAAGEAFDKVGKMLGLPYPGGPEIAKQAETGRRNAYSFPRSMIQSGDFHFSFSGLKTSAHHALKLHSLPLEQKQMADFCASFQEAIVEVLVSKLLLAAETLGTTLISVSGGVSCNLRLRESILCEASRRGLEVLLSEPHYATDNAAMIAFAAAMRRKAGIAPSPLNADINPNLRLA